MTTRKTGWRWGVLGVLLALVPLSAGTEALAATVVRAVKVDRGPEVDGRVDKVWNKTSAVKVVVDTGDPGRIKVSLKALYDAENVYFLVRWQDETQNLFFQPWEYDGEEWVQSDEEDDRLAFAWNISSPAFPAAGCYGLCHVSKEPEVDGATPNDMWTNQPGEKVDLWDWSSGVTNPLGYARDFAIDCIDFKEFVVAHPDRKTTGRRPDGEVEAKGRLMLPNVNVMDDGPQFAPLPRERAQGPFIIVRGPGSVLDTEGLEFKKGDRVTGIVLPGKIPADLRGHLTAKGIHRKGRWVLEIKRPLVTGEPDDVQFEVGKQYHFGIAVFDRTDKHSISLQPLQFQLRR
ncbi:MAG: ethylbenzene dehydrogenase-related protein [Candidatus Methylomirabilia bacterium]